MSGHDQRLQVSDDYNIDSSVNENESNSELGDEDFIMHNRADDDQLHPVEESAAFSRASQSAQAQHIDSEENSDASESEGCSDDFRHSSTDFLRDIMNNGLNRPNSILLDVVNRLVGSLGSGLENLMSEMDALIQNLEQRDDTFLILESLNEILERLLMMNGLTAERLVPSFRLARCLVNILRDAALQEELELHLVACRCLYNFIEVNQDFIHDVLHNNAVKFLVEKIQEISYIDLTEQALQTLEMISLEKIAQPAIANNNGLKACLKNLDFLTIHAQRKCLLIVSNTCESLQELHFGSILEVFPMLVEVIERNNDDVIVESAWHSFANIVTTFKHQTSCLEKLFDNQSLLRLLVEQFHVSSNPNALWKSLSLRARTTLLRSLLFLADLSIKISCEMLQLGIGPKVRDSIIGQKEPQNDSRAADLQINVPRDIHSQILLLIAVLCPKNYASASSPFIPTVRQDFTLSDHLAEERVLAYLSFLSNLTDFFIAVWPVLVGTFSSSIDQELRLRAFICIYRIVLYSNQEFILESLTSGLSAVIATIFMRSKEELSQENVSEGFFQDSKGQKLLLASVQIMSDITKKGCVLNQLEKEGVFNELEIILSLLETKALHGEVYTLDSSKPIILHNRMSLIDLDFSSESEEEPPFTCLQEVVRTAKDVLTAYSNHSREREGIQGQLADKFAKLSGEILHNLNSSQNERITQWRLLQDALSDSIEDLSGFELLSLGLVDVLHEIFWSPSSEEKREWKSIRNHTVVERLVALLQESLTRSEAFDVLSFEKHFSDSVYNHPIALSRQIKLRLVPEDQSRLQPEGPILAVQAIATGSSIEKFIHEKNTSTLGLPIELHTQPSLHLKINGNQIRSDETVISALVRSAQVSHRGGSDPRQIWTKIHDLKYSVLQQPYNDIKQKDKDAYSLRERTTKILHVLMSFHNLEDRGVAEQEDKCVKFENWKISSKVRRQLEEIFVVACGLIPQWIYILMRHFSFLFPTDLKIMFMKCTSYGHSRLVQEWITSSGGDSFHDGSTHIAASLRNTLLGVISRQKFRVGRSNILASAMHILENYGGTPNLLEMEFYDEVGSGLGPTLEFYSLVSREFFRDDLGMWRNEGTSTKLNDFVIAPKGLFPSPLSPKSQKGEKIHRLFKNLGTFIARALMDSRLIELDLNPLFIQLVFQVIDDSPKDMDWLSLLPHVDERLSKSLHQLLSLKQENDLLSLRTLEINFTIPGYPDIELKEGGADLWVTDENIEQYVNLVARSTLWDCVVAQIVSFISGFNEVFSIEAIRTFTPDELKAIIGNVDEDWSESTLFSFIKTNHGYNKNSSAFLNLIKVLSEFLAKERRKFLQFLTGSPKLPIGGFKNVHPEFTVVKKEAELDRKGDDYLPSVMTCANYLKLPEYSLRDVLKQRLLQAINEGAGSFYLS